MNILSLKEEFLSQQEIILKDLKDKIDIIVTLPSIEMSSLNKKQTLVINIDLNNGFAVSGNLFSEKTAKMIAPTAKFLEKMSANGFDVMAYSDCHTENSPEFEFFPEHCIDTTNEYLLPTQIQKHCDVIVYKNSTNALLAKSPFDMYSDKTCFIVTGCLTEICIYQFSTTLRAYLNQHNMQKCQIIVPIDLIDTYDAPNHNAVLYNTMYISGLIENGIKCVSTIL